MFTKTLAASAAAFLVFSVASTAQAGKSFLLNGLDSKVDFSEPGKIKFVEPGTDLVNIMDISLTILQDYFAMIMLVDLTDMKLSFSDLSQKLAEQGKTIGVQIKIQREEVFKAMHQL